MKYSWVRMVTLIGVLMLVFSMVSAQETITFISEEGVIVEHPNNWEFDQERDDRIGFSNSTMIGDIEYTEIDDVDQDYLAELEDWAEDEGDDDDGIFTEIETYTLADGWNAARTLRIRTDDRLFEVLIVADVSGYMLYLDATFRIGAQDFYLPQFDTVLNSFRSVDDFTVHTISSITQPPVITGQIGSEVNPLDIGALTANYVTLDNQYQFNYPQDWQLDVDAEANVTFLGTNDSIIFGTVEIMPVSDDSLASLLDNDVTDIIPEAFVLNDLPAIRIINNDMTNNVREVTMATVRGDIQVIIRATMSIDNADNFEAILRGVLYSVRPNGEPFTLSVLGGAVRTGLNSAGIYGSPVEVVIDAEDVLLNAFTSSRNGQYTLNYPDDWYSDVEFGFIILSTEENYLIYEPDRDEAQILVSFFDQIAGIDGIDDFTSESLLEYLIDNSFDRRSWDDVELIDNDNGNEIAYADFDYFGDVIRTYLVEIDTVRDIFVRLELVVDEDDVEDYHELALSVLATTRFQD